MFELETCQEKKKVSDQPCYRLNCVAPKCLCRSLDHLLFQNITAFGGKSLFIYFLPVLPRLWDLSSLTRD